MNLTAVRGQTPSLGVSAVSPDAAGVFALSGVTPGRYRVMTTNASGWLLRSAMVQGRDALDEPFEIKNADVTNAELTLTDRLAEISGDLLDVSGLPAPGYFIIVFPAEKAYWTAQSRRIQSTRPGSDGHFRVQNLPPANYLIAAVTDVEPGEWYDPTFLSQLVSASTPVALVEGEKKIQSLKIKSGGQLR